MAGGPTTTLFDQSYVHLPLRFVIDSALATPCSSTQIHSCSVLPAAKRNEYQAYETEVFEALAALVRDAASLRVYLAAAMRVEAETFTRATVTGQVLSSASGMNPNQLVDGQHALANNQAGVTQNPCLSETALS